MNIDFFVAWLEDQGAQVACTQEDDGSGYAVFEVTPPGGATFVVSVDAATT